MKQHSEQLIRSWCFWLSWRLLYLHMYILVCFPTQECLCIVYWYIFDSAYSMLRHLESDSSASFASFAHPAQTPNSSARPGLLPVSYPTDTYNFRKK